MPLADTLMAAGALVGGVALAIERGLSLRRYSNGKDPLARTAIHLDRLAALVEQHEGKDEGRHQEAMRAAVDASKDLDHIKTVIDRR